MRILLVGFSIYNIQMYDLMFYWFKLKLKRTQCPEIRDSKYYYSGRLREKIVTIL